MAKKEPGLTLDQAWGRDALMVIAAFRYCLGRMSYIVSDCTQWLIHNWETIPDHAKTIIQKELDEAFARDAERTGSESDPLISPLGWPCDKAEWAKVRALWRTPDAS